MYCLYFVSSIVTIVSIFLRLIMVILVLFLGMRQFGWFRYYFLGWWSRLMVFSFILSVLHLISVSLAIFSCFLANCCLGLEKELFGGIEERL